MPTLPLVFTFTLVCYVIGGAAHGTKNVLIRTLLHQRVPARLHGRAFAAYNAVRNGAEMVALLLGGLLIAAIGARWTLLLAEVIPALAGLIGLAAYRRLRNRDVEPLAGAGVA
ncbi:MAG: MFS transporter [Actinomycetota bacterium]|nr:MFS transporter [Actinomycetota bacterium]